MYSIPPLGDTGEDSETIHFEWAEDMYLKAQLGILEWAKMVTFEAVKIDNALEAYAEEEV